MPQKFLKNSLKMTEVISEYDFLEACWHGCFETIKKYAESGGDVHINNEEAFRKCCHFGYFDIVKYLVEEHNADIHAENEDGFHGSCHMTNFNIDICKYLISKGVNIHTENEEGFRNACATGSLELVKCLAKEHNANVHAKNEEGLQNACQYGYFEIVKFLVEEYDVDISAENQRAFWLACGGPGSGENLKLVKYLSEECNADVHHDNNSGLISACYYYNVDIIEYLVHDHNAYLSDDAKSEIIRRICFYPNIKFIKYFVQKFDIDVYANNIEGFFQAFSMNLKDTILYFIEITNFQKHIDKLQEMIRENNSYYFFRPAKLDRVIFHKLLEAKSRCIKYEIHNSLITNKKMPQEIVQTHLMPFLI